MVLIATSSLISAVLAAAVAVVPVQGAALHKPNNTAPTWAKLAPIDGIRQEHGVATINETTIAILGGVAGDLFNSTDAVDFYDIPTNTWYNVESAPYAVNHPNVAAVNGKLYLLGGLIDGPARPDKQINWVASRECAVYDPTANTWTALEDMPSGTERGSANVGVHGEMVYLAGGMTLLNPDYQDSLTMVTAFNTTSGHWQRVPPAAADIPEGRQHGVGAVINNTFYVVGGRWFSQEGVRGTVFKLDLNNKAAGWTTSRGRMPVPRGGISGGVVKDKIYIFGGEGNKSSASGIFNQAEVFDASTESWKELQPMSVPRHGTQATAAGNRIYIPGGGLQQDGKPVMVNGKLTFSQPTGYLDAFVV